MFSITITPFSVSILCALSDEISLTLEETVWVGNLITSAHWTENDHCERNKANVLAWENDLGFPAVFWIRKCQVKTPPVRHFTPHHWSPCKMVRYGLETLPTTNNSSHALTPLCNIDLTFMTHSRHIHNVATEQIHYVFEGIYDCTFHQDMS